MNTVANIPVAINFKKPLSLTSKYFHENKFEIYAYLRGHLPVHRVSILGLKLYATARYDDCLTVLKDDRFGRDRAAITGGGPLPFPLPKTVKLLSKSMIIEDDPQHRRLRNLVQKAFSPKRLTEVEARIQVLAHELVDKLSQQDVVNLQKEYALAIPVAAIAQMMGVNTQEMDKLRNSIRVLSDGLTGLNILRTFAWDLRRAVNDIRALIERKRREPGEDILTALIEAEEEGDKLSEDELISMIFLLIIAGFETTVHLITNGVLTLLEYPEQLEKLRSTPALLGSTVEEILRFSGPVHGTKMNYAKEDVDLRGVTIPKGSPVFPLLASANRDEDIFENSETFDISRNPNKHLSFSQGNHFCLGAFLARMEAKVAFGTLVEQCPNLQLAVPVHELKLQRTPGWHRYDGLPVKLA